MAFTSIATAIFPSPWLNTAAGPTPYQPFTSCAVVQLSAASTSNPVMMIQSWGSTVGAYTYNAAPAIYSGAQVGGSSTISIGSPHAVCFIWAFAGQASVWIDGSQVAVGDASANRPSGGISVGWNGSGSFFNGYVGRLEIFSGALSAADIATWTANMRSEFNF